MNWCIDIDKKVLAAAELYKHLYDLKDWHIEDESVHSYLEEMCRKGCIQDYLNIFDRPTSRKTVGLQAEHTA